MLTLSVIWYFLGKIVLDGAGENWISPKVKKIEKDMNGT